ncbi:MAG: hypothetical protein COB76_01560 [Alphaproteobacteria bacterium]|nr:MAG: hypothetical protein COB76_01560 [Alphaproteobacteria bacterium]
MKNVSLKAFAKSARDKFVFASGYALGKVDTFLDPAGTFAAISKEIDNEDILESKEMDRARIRKRHKTPFQQGRAIARNPFL